MFQTSMRAIPTVESNPVAASAAGPGEERGVRGGFRGRSRSAVLRPFLLLLTLVVTILIAVPTPAHAASGSQCSNTCGWWSTPFLGQTRIQQGLYQEAITIFTCYLDGHPLSVDAYRGRIEASLMLGRYSDALRDYAHLTAEVAPTNPNVQATIYWGYAWRLALNPWDVPALTGASFARWWFFEYEDALPLLDKLLVVKPNSVYGALFRGSTRLFVGEDIAGGEAELARAVQLSPSSPHVRFIVADAYTYALPDTDRAFEEATLALAWGLDTPRVHAILANANLARNDSFAAAYHLGRHIDLVTKETEEGDDLVVGDDVALDLVPGRTFELDVSATAGEPITITTDSPSGEIADSILVLLDPEGTPIVGNDDHVGFFAGLAGWIAPETGTYRLRVTSFESVGTGELVVTRN